MARTVIGVFDDWAAAEHVVDEPTLAGEQRRVLDARHRAPAAEPTRFDRGTHRLPFSPAHAAQAAILPSGRARRSAPQRSAFGKKSWAPSIR